MIHNLIFKRIASRFHPKEFKKYFVNTSWLLCGKIAGILSTFIASILVARYLGPQLFGILAFSSTFVLLFSSFSTLGLNNIFIRELVKNPNNQNELLGTSFFLTLSGSIFTCIFIFLISPIANHTEDQINILILIITVSLIFKPFLIFEWYFLSKVQSKFIAYANFFQTLISLFITLLLIFLKAPLIYFALIFIINPLINTIFLVHFFLKKSQSLSKWQFNRQLALKLLQDSWPLLLSGIAIMIYMKIDQIMIKYMINVSEVGIYSVAVRLSEAWYFIPIIICESLFPAILKAKQISENFYHTRLKNLYSLMLWISLPIAIIITFWAENIISFLFGLQYIEAANVLKIHIWAGIFVFWGVATGKYLISENYTKISFLRTFIGMIINIILNYVLIPKYGIMGAAVATVFSYALATFVIIFFPKTRIQAVNMICSVGFNPFLLK